MGILIEKIKTWRIFNSGIIKKIKDFIYFKIISPRKEGKTDKYRKEIMDIIYQVFDNKKWILSCGSFLRFYRDKTMVKQDIDIFLYEEDLEELKEQLKNQGFGIKTRFYDNEGKITEYKYLYKGVEIDFFIVRQDDEGKDYMIFTMEDRGNDLKVSKKVENECIIVTGEDYKSWKRYISDFEKITTYEFEGFKFNGPEYAEKHIVELYGENWKVYDPNYDPRYAPENNMPIPGKNAKAIIYLKEEK